MLNYICQQRAIKGCSICKDASFNTLREFSSSTSLHGLKRIIDDFDYLNESSTWKKLPKWMKFIAKFGVWTIWGGSFLVGVALLVILNILFWQREQAISTITTIDTYYYNIYAVPFPSITLCNINAIHRPKLQHLIDKLTDVGFNESEIIDTASDYRVLVKLNHEQWPVSNRTIAHDMLLHGYEVDVLMLRLMQPCSEMIKICSWIDRLIPCEKLFFVSKSSEGYCCSFNYEHIMRLNDTRNNNEFRSSGYGEFVGLDLLLSPDTDNYVSYKKPFDGIDVSIHGREDYTDTGYFFSVSPGYDVNVFLTPSVLATDNEVRSLSPTKRNCLFKDEKALLMTNKYSFSSCMADCHVRAYIKQCNCIPFYYMHTELAEFNKIPQCKFAHVECMNQIRNLISSNDPPAHHNPFSHFKNITHIKLNCSCMAGCHEVRYDSQVSLLNTHVSPDSNSNASITKFNISANEMKKHTILKIAFQDSTCIKYRRSIYMTWKDLLGSLGGIIGLCVGGSCISLIEILHFFLIRAIGRNLLDYSQRNSVEPNLQQVFIITSKRHFQRPFVN